MISSIGLTSADAGIDEKTNEVVEKRISSWMPQKTRLAATEEPGSLSSNQRERENRPAAVAGTGRLTILPNVFLRSKPSNGLGVPVSIAFLSLGVKRGA